MTQADAITPSNNVGGRPHEVVPVQETKVGVPGTKSGSHISKHSNSRLSVTFVDYIFSCQLYSMWNWAGAQVYF